MDFGKMIKARRLALGLTLEQVGDACGVGKSTVRKWENETIRNVGRSKLALLAKVLQIKPDELIGDEDNATVVSATIPPRFEISDEEKVLVLAFRAAPQGYKDAIWDMLNNYKRRTDP